MLFAHIGKNSLRLGSAVGSSPCLQHGWWDALTVRQESQTVEKWKFPKDRNGSDIRRAR